MVNKYVNNVIFVTFKIVSNDTDCILLVKIK